MLVLNSEYMTSCPPSVFAVRSRENSFAYFLYVKANFIFFVTSVWFDSYCPSVCRGQGLVTFGDARYLGSSGAESSSEGVDVFSWGSQGCMRGVQGV